MAAAFGFAIIGSAHAMSMSGFVDVDANTEFQTAIEYIQDKGLVQGYADGSYRPESTINRYDFTKIIVGARYSEAEIMDCDVNAYSFPDVPTDQWFSPYVCTAKKNGIVNGYADGTFGGQNNVSHPEALKIVLETFAIPTTEEAGDTWYDPYLRAAAENDINTALPADVNYVITRGDMAELVVNSEASSPFTIPSRMADDSMDEDDSMIDAGDDMSGSEETRNIVQLASETDDLSTLATAVAAGGLVGTLTANGPFTVFAPTNTAFDALPEGTLETLLEEENQLELQNILKFHVVSGAYMAGDLSDGMQVPTANGDTLTISIVGETVMVGSATVVSADIPASNGVVHVIDTVLLPGEDEEMAMEDDPFMYEAYSEAAFAAAQSEGKSSAIFFHADWCPTCAAMESTINENMDNLPDGSVMLKADFDTEKDLLQEYGVTMQSTVIFFDSAGMETARAMDPSVDEMIDNLQPADEEDNVVMEADTEQFAYVDYSPSAFTAAQADGKNSAIFFHADWCPTCAAMESTINENMDNLPDGSVILKADYDTETDLRQAYGVTTQSTVIFFDSAGMETARAMDPSVDDMVTYLQ